MSAPLCAPGDPRLLRSPVVWVFRRAATLEVGIEALRLADRLTDMVKEGLVATD